MAIGTCYEGEVPVNQYDIEEEQSLTGITLSDIVYVDFSVKTEADAE